MTTDFALLGLAAGIGIVLAIAGLGKRRVALSTEMTLYDPASALVMADGESWRHPSGALATFGTLLDRIVNRGTRSTRSQDLVVTGRSFERHAIVTAVATLVGAAGPAVLVALATSIGLHVPSTDVLLLCGIGVGSGVLLPTVELRRAARKETERFLRAFSCWLELVALAQAGGMGIESALDAAGRISPDPAFARIRQALERSRHSATTPWEEIGRLGAELGIDELGELAASLGLAGVEGARIRSSLQAKSASLRHKQMAEAKARANSTTERLFLPSIVLMLGFMVFLMYPAGVSLTHVL